MDLFRLKVALRLQHNGCKQARNSSAGVVA
jgi:hypothetical protein